MHIFISVQLLSVAFCQHFTTQRKQRPKQQGGNETEISRGAVYFSEENTLGQRNNKLDIQGTIRDYLTTMNVQKCSSIGTFNNASSV